MPGLGPGLLDFENSYFGNSNYNFHLDFSRDYSTVINNYDFNASFMVPYQRLNGICWNSRSIN